LGGPHVYPKHLRGPIKQTLKNNSWLILWYGLSSSIQIHIIYLFDKYVLSVFSDLFFNCPRRKVCPPWTLKQDLWLLRRWVLGHSSPWKKKGGEILYGTNFFSCLTKQWTSLVGRSDLGDFLAIFRTFFVMEINKLPISRPRPTHFVKMLQPTSNDSCQ
jgi:hypothetical protein